MPRSAKQNNESGRKYSLNQEYFNQIDSEEKAYFLGFIFADGNISCSKKTYSLRLHIHRQDIKILEKLKYALGSDSPIKIDKRGYAVYVVNSKRMTLDLISHGAVVKKTFKISFPFDSVPQELRRHFLRGYFDGDGSFSRGLVSNMAFSIVSNTVFIQQIQDFLIESISLRRTKLSDTKSDGIKTMRYSGRRQFVKFFDFIYKDASVFLERKKNKAEMYLLDAKNLMTKKYILISPNGVEYSEFTFSKIQKLGGPCKKSIYKMLENNCQINGWSTRPNSYDIAELEKSS